MRQVVEAPPQRMRLPEELQRGVIGHHRIVGYV